MRRAAAGLIFMLALQACSLWELLPTGARESQDEGAVPAMVIEDVYGTPSVRQDIYSRSGIIEPLPTPSDRSALEPYRAGQRLGSQP